MTKDKEYHPNFVEYMNEIVNHPNYEGLPINKKKDGTYSWIATEKSDVGKRRVIWCLEKGKQLGFKIENGPYPGFYADVMRTIHPTRIKPCSICGKEMSIYYHYPNKLFLKELNKHFDTSFTENDHISDIWDELVDLGYSDISIKEFMISKENLDLDVERSDKEEVISQLEFLCRTKVKKCLGPGAMSNFPDRFDGFHTYNRCCRATQDKGRSKENLRSYGKDRRAYEYWSDGNIHAANQFMNSPFFDGVSGDHIGPISLGFVHDPRYIQPMLSGDNSSKRDRLLVEDVEKIIAIEKRTGVCPISWYSKLIWVHIRSNYSTHQNIVKTLYRDTLKQMMTNYMYILNSIIEFSSEQGKEFLIEKFLKPNYDNFKYSYDFNEQGDIVSKKARHLTGRTENEFERYVRISFDSVSDYFDKENRNLKQDLSNSELRCLESLCSLIAEHDYERGYIQLAELVKSIQLRLIDALPD